MANDAGLTSVVVPNFSAASSGVQDRYGKSVPARNEPITHLAGDESRISMLISRRMIAYAWGANRDTPPAPALTARGDCLNELFSFV
jgi:hypothetical protein